VAEAGRLGQSFIIEELRGGLKRDRFKLLGPMDPARGVNVKDRDREDRLPETPKEPTSHMLRPRPGALANHMVARVDRAQQRIEMFWGPEFVGGCYQDERLAAPFESLLECATPTAAADRHDDAFDFPTPLLDHAFERSHDLFRLLDVPLAQQDHADARACPRLSMVVSFDGVDGFVERGHSNSGRAQKLRRLDKGGGTRPTPPSSFTRTPTLTHSTPSTQSIELGAESPRPAQAG